EEYEKIIYDWNATDKPYPNHSTIHRLFEEQVLRTPDNIAVVYEGQQLTYQELNENANRLAHYIRQHIVIKHDTLMSLCLDRSEYMLIVILAVLKAGGAYVPIDSEYPDERIKYILGDTDSKVILINEVYKERLANLVNTDYRNIIVIDSEKTQQELQTQPVENLTTLTNSKNLAYVIYTSGTTGDPKGVMIEHEGVVNRIKWMNDTYPLDFSDKILQKTAYTFDVSVWELLWAHWYGATLVVAKPGGHKDTEYLIDLISKESITTIHFVPSMLSPFINSLAIKSNNWELNLQRIFCSGEVLKLSQVQECQRVLVNATVHNLYGPTEASIDVLYYDCTNRNINKILIGKPISNTNVYILNDMIEPLPIGAIGELYIGGVGLARGYLNKPNLTAEKFILNPFQSEEQKTQGKNARLYKTGDLVRSLPDGNLEYIGRNDFQVKIRGYRIELEEVEVALSAYEGIRQSVVLANEHKHVEGLSIGSKYLVGYYVSDVKLDEETILSNLQTKLPDYMVPSILVHIEKLPLTINGKLDRKALPVSKFTSKDSYIAPRNKLERKVSEIWAEVLGLFKDKVGIHDDFFKLGGDSIVSIQLVSRLRQRLGLTVSIKDIFNYKTIEKLYDNVLIRDNGSSKVSIQNEQGILSGEVPLLPVQELFFIQNIPVRDHYNQSFLIKVNNIDLLKLKGSLIKLIKHHDAFHLRYKKSSDTGEFIQYYFPLEVTLNLKTLDIIKLNYTEGTEEFDNYIQEVLTLWQNHFNIQESPLYSVGYISGYKDGTSRIFFAFHHLIVDTISWRIILEDLKSLYDGFELNAKQTSYRQWSNELINYVHKAPEEKTYWQEWIKLYNIHEQKFIAEQKNKLINYDEMILNSDYTAKLLKETNRAFNTQINDLLLTSLAYSLFEMTNSTEHYIVLEGHGREEIADYLDVSKTMGWFTTIYPVRLEVGSTIKNTIINIKEELRKIPNKGIGYGVFIGYKDVKLPFISFNYLGKFESGIYEEGHWVISGENAGNSLDPQNLCINKALDINGVIINDQLRFSVISRLDTIRTRDFTKILKSQLEKIIDFAHNSRSFLTTSDVSYIISQQYLDKLQQVREIEKVYLANSLQQGFIFNSLNQTLYDDAYLVQMLWEYKTCINIEKFKEAWQHAVKKYPSLRLRFAWEFEIVQVIDKHQTLDFRYIDRSSRGREKNFNITPIITEIQQIDRKEEYKLETGNLCRVYLIKLKDNLYVCLLSFHHSILDGWSIPILTEYVHKTYLQLMHDIQISEENEITYCKTQEYLQLLSDKSFWLDYLTHISEPTDLNSLCKHQNTNLDQYRQIQEIGDEIQNIGEKTYLELRKITRQAGFTFNALLHFAWHKTLSIYTNSKQTVVGVTVSGRNLPIHDIEHSVGLFINTLPFVVKHNDIYSGTIESIIQIQKNINDINSNVAVNLSEIQKHGRQLFNSLFIYENFPQPKGDSNELGMKYINGMEKYDYPLVLVAYESKDNLFLKVCFAQELFDNNIIKQLLATTFYILEQISSLASDASKQ
ncbi:MAG: amino acid adenylation domain-containing protein, partial [Alphaproteobacteria bacterium]|nr:amino acid adenylation domain-containing protein [Alphaproteobacteria bacterium]